MKAIFGGTTVLGGWIFCHTDKYYYQYTHLMTGEDVSDGWLLDNEKSRQMEDNFVFILIKISSMSQECSQKGDSGCASEKLGVPHLLSD